MAVCVCVCERERGREREREKRRGGGNRDKCIFKLQRFISLQCLFVAQDKVPVMSKIYRTLEAHMRRRKNSVNEQQRLPPEEVRPIALKSGHLPHLLRVTASRFKLFPEQDTSKYSGSTCFRVLLTVLCSESDSSEANPQCLDFVARM